MKRLVSPIILIFLTFNAFGQYGNEWIQYHQSYYKIPVAFDGLYRLSYEALQQAGFPLSTDPQTFQLFRRGVEQAIIVQGEDDGVFDTPDYIEFFGRSNDGVLDTSLYEDPAYQPHRFYNLYTDTASYFLTYGSGRGKRMTTYEGSSAASRHVHHLAEKLLILKESYSAGRGYGNVHKTVFDLGEGWTGVQILQNQEVTYSLQGIAHTASAAGNPVLEVLLTGRGAMNHDVEIYVAGRLLSTVNFQGHASYKFTGEIQWSDIDGQGHLSVRVRVTGAGGSDRVSAGYIRLEYPQSLVMTGVTEKTFHLPATDAAVLLKIEEPPPGARLFDVTDPSNAMHIAGQLTTTLDAVVSPGATPRKIIATAAVHLPARIKAVSFRQLNPAVFNYMIISHPALRKPALGYVDPVKAYAEYRSLPEGGGFDTLIVNIDQLYDQFNYGEPSPRAIFQFMKFAASIKLPDYVLLIGKGLNVNYGYHRNPSAFTLYKDLIPVAGYPGSDMAYSAGLSGIPEVPAVATGRLTANSPAEVAAYLNKVKERDALPFDHLARKEILHLSGGIEEREPALFRSIMEGFERIAEDLFLGGDVQAVGKQSTETKLVNVAEKVNEGLGLITFFGHSAPNTLDFDIGLVTDPVMGYDNPGKYPFLLMNGCDVGSFFLNANILGENWIKARDKGAIGFIAHSSYGQITALQRYSTTLYHVGFGDSVFIKKGVGQVQQEVAKRYVGKYGSSPQAISQIQQMVLLGDPAVKLFGAAKPDFAVDENAVFVSGFHDEPITALTDSFRLHIPVRNFGITNGEDILVEVTRQYGDGTVHHYDSLFPAVLFNDTLTLIIRRADQEGFGMNNFSIHVDARNDVAELSETNNTANYAFFIPLNSTRNLYPYNLSIVKARQIDLSFQYTDLLADSRNFLVEIDTTRTFDSGFKQLFQVSGVVVARQRVELLDADSVVYYWRTVLADPLENESKTWAVSSFTYLSDGPEGWAQLRFPQHESNTLSRLTRDAVLERIEFTETVSDIAVKTFSSASGRPRDSVSFKINGVEFNLSSEGGGCRNNTINLVAFDKKSTQPYPGLYFKWYEPGRRLLCGREPYVINSFFPEELITGNQDDLVQYMDNIQAGDSVVLFNIGDAGYSKWPEAARTKLAELGISTAQLAGIQDGDPVIIFGRKGSASGTAGFYHGPFPQTFVEVRKTIAGRFTAGAVTSPLIGPATRWDQFSVQIAEAEPSDQFGVTLLGIRADAGVDTLRTDVVKDADLSDVSAAQYPYLKIILDAGDEMNLTAVQLKKWIITYEPVAEGLVFYRGPHEQQVVFEGQTLSADFGFFNISDKNFSDSLTVRYDLLNRYHPGNTKSVMKITAPPPGDTTLFTVHFNTVSKTGINDVQVFVNPGLERETLYENNVIVISEHLNVLGDRSHPVLDVTFDGRHLENNAFVRANPEIAIRLWDENPFIQKEDTVGIRIFLGYPCAMENCGFEHIYFSRDDVAWQPASKTSDFTVNFAPAALADGNYILRVEASDARGNASGDAPYEIRFRVKHEQTVVALPPYPNPFGKEVHFEIVITGDRVHPLFYHLQLLDINGKRVRDLRDDTMPLYVGKNFISWDGLGADGEALPGGIYFYRLQIEGDEPECEISGRVVLLR